jgi:hypothetical protein
MADDGACAAPFADGLTVGEIVNLNQFRKARERAEAEERAKRNRAKHGLSKTARLKREREAEQRRKLLDGKQIGTGDGSDGGDSNTDVTERE